jgi:hypothetical protein
MTAKTEVNVLLFSLFGIVLWFFGNLYEGIVIAPNLLTDSMEKISSWRAFFTITNPVFFYIPLVPIAVISTVAVYVKTLNEHAILKTHLRRAIIFLVPSLLLGIFIIVRINLKLFFGDIRKLQADVYRLSLLWNVLNAVRLVLLIFVIHHLLKAYVFLRNKAFDAG